MQNLNRKTTANMGLAKSGRTVLNQTFVLLINSSACRQFGASNARLRQALNRCASCLGTLLT